MSDAVVYVGKAGERSGSAGDKPMKGLWGRLGAYSSGKAATSGFGQAALDRALAEPAFVRARLQHLETVGPQRTIAWTQAAIAFWQPTIGWTTTPTGADALLLERRVEDVLTSTGLPLWNR